MVVHLCFCSHSRCGSGYCGCGSSSGVGRADSAHRNYPVIDSYDGDGGRYVKMVFTDFDVVKTPKTLKLYIYSRVMVHIYSVKKFSSSI